MFLVTGSTDGIGQHTAIKLAQAGATVLVHGRLVGRTTTLWAVQCGMIRQLAGHDSTVAVLAVHCST